jgi:hypothetical protein
VLIRPGTPPVWPSPFVHATNFRLAQNEAGDEPRTFQEFPSFDQDIPSRLAVYGM